MEGNKDHLVYHPQVFSLGVGCARNCPAEEMSALVSKALAEAGIAPGAIAAVFSIDLKADEPAVIELARQLVSRGAQVIVSGCTEIPLVMASADVDVPLVSSIDALAMRTIALARGALPLPAVKRS